ncbi:MAG TPA: glycosyltransferase family 2 protein [Gaiellaceae bacterium]
MPEVSVCIPAYRQPEFLSRAVQSVLTQDFGDFEIVITDDSPDSDVMDVVKAVGDSRVRYSRNSTRLGSPANWVAALSRSRGQLIKFMHHDDCFSRPDSLGRFVRMLDDPRVDFGFSASQVVDPDQRPLWVHKPAERIDEMRMNPYVLLLGNWIGAPSATIYRRTAPARIDTRLKWVVDIDFYLTMLVQNRQFAYDDNALVATTLGAPHQVTGDVQRDPRVALAEWFILAAKWAGVTWRRSELLDYLGDLQLQYDFRNWRDYHALGLHGRAARLFVLAYLGKRFAHEEDE